MILSVIYSGACKWKWGKKVKKIDKIDNVKVQQVGEPRYGFLNYVEEVNFV